MVVARPPKVNPPSGRAPGQLLLAIPRSESRRRHNSGRNRVMGLLPMVFRARTKYRWKGPRGEAPPDQAARWRGLPAGRARMAPGHGVAPLRPSLGLLESCI